jgi:hypothetical protein
MQTSLVVWMVMAAACAPPPAPLPIRHAVAPGDLPVRDAQPPVALDSRFARLTHRQYRRAAADLLGLTASDVSDVQLREESGAGGGLFERPGRLRVDEVLWSDYAVAAELLAARATSTTERIEALAPAVDGDGAPRSVEDRREHFLATHGLRAHRNLLTPRHLDAYRVLFDRGASFYADDAMAPDPVRDGIRAVLEAWLQSPYFLYRVELGTGLGDGDLTPFEIASRLSFALWDTMPDDELLSAAKDGALWFDGETPSPTLAEQVERMLDDERTEAAVLAFHRRLFGVERYPHLAMPAFLGVSDAWGTHVAKEHELLVASVYERDEGLRELLTTRRTFVNGELAARYGLEPDDVRRVTFEEVELPHKERAGLLTSLGFLSDHASGGAPDAIHRGVFISRQLVCNEVPPPPDDIPPLASVEPGQTTRETIEALTEQPGTSCEGCHASYINPFGFALEGYDATGAVRDDDHGYAIDTSSILWVGRESYKVDDAVEMTELLAELPAVHRCYAGHWVSFLIGRAPDAAHDEEALRAAAARSLEQTGSLRQLLFDLVTSEAFLTRVDEEARR